MIAAVLARIDQVPEGQLLSIVAAWLAVGAVFMIFWSIPLGWPLLATAAVMLALMMLSALVVSFVQDVRATVRSPRSAPRM